MKFEKKFFIFLISLLIIVLTIIFFKNYNLYKEMYEVSKMPLSSLSILNNEVKLEDNQHTYNINIDCSSLKDPNNQIISYDLFKFAEKANVSIATKIYDGDKVLTDDYSHLTSINTSLSITDQNKKYEQVFVINATCE